MLEQLPHEVLSQVIAELPTVSAIRSVSRTSQKLRSTIDDDASNIYRSFIQRVFPTISTPPYWQEAAFALTSRSRAWQRRAVVARSCYPPTSHAEGSDHTSIRNTFGFVPAIDSYEEFSSDSLSSRREVIAWGAGGRINVRLKDIDSSHWRCLRFENDTDAMEDILDLRLLRTDQKTNAEQTIVFRRANGVIGALETSSDSESGYAEYASFANTQRASSMDVSRAREPLMAAVFSGRSVLQLYPVMAPDAHIDPSATIGLPHCTTHTSKDAPITRFLSTNMVAVSTSVSKDCEIAPFRIFDIASGGRDAKTEPVWQMPSTAGYGVGDTINCILPLDPIYGNARQCFLTGWSNGQVLLSDTRSPAPFVSRFYDWIDVGSNLSLAAHGHERFVAGSSQNACMAFFEMRKPGQRSYSYLESRNVAHIRSPTKSKQDLIGRQSAASRDFSVFLSVRVWNRSSLWQPMPLPRQHAGTHRYSGSVYSLSVPSPTSPTIYAGIESHVLQLDLVNSDDVDEDNIDPFLHDLKAEKSSNVWCLGCYEHPRQGNDSSDAVLLNKQAMWHEMRAQPHQNEESDAAGWDIRWRLGDVAGADSQQKGSRRGLGFASPLPNRGWGR
jgi:hypothetical protein